MNRKTEDHTCQLVDYLFNLIVVFIIFITSRQTPNHILFVEFRGQKNLAIFVDVLNSLVF